MPNSGSLFSIKPESLPGWLTPDKSPFMSAMKQGTPALQKLSAITCSVTVLPVPVAPAISPCLLAMLPRMLMGPLGPWAI